MTAVIHHGAPGSYKSFSIVQNVVIPALKKGRTVVTNIRGLDDINRIQTALDIELPKEARLMNVPHDSNAGFEKMATFFHWVPVGALIVMDEGQRVYPTRLRSLLCFDLPLDLQETLEGGIQRPSTVENAFDQHRHMNWDIYISTTNVAKIHKEVRAVAEYAFRHRDLSGVLPWLKDTWNEFKHDPETTGKLPSHYIGTPVKHKADKRIFECYRSTATGEAKSSNENKNIFNDTKLRLVILVIVVALSMFIWSLSQAISSDDQSVDLLGTETSPPFVSTNSNDGVLSGDQNASSRYDLSMEDFTPDLFGSSQVYFTGVFYGRLYFQLISEKKVTTLTSDDLRSVGYGVSRVSDCLALITTFNSVRYVKCSPVDIEQPTKKEFALTDKF